jgi:hypothetical protein
MAEIFEQCDRREVHGAHRHSVMDRAVVCLGRSVAEQFDQWAIVELLGHRRLAGRIREAQLAGAGFLRLDIPASDGNAAQTQFISPAAVYALHPVTEEIARQIAGTYPVEPVSRWELTAARDDESERAVYLGDDGEDEVGL